MANPHKEKLKDNGGQWPQNLSLLAQHAIAVGILFAALLFFFHEAVFDGKVFTSGDTVASHSFETYMHDTQVQSVDPLWNPYIFCGMPGVASLSVGNARLYDVSDFIFQNVRKVTKYLFLNVDLGATLFYYLIFSVGMYFFAYSKLKHWLASLVVALGATFSMFIIIWAMVGHITKIGVVAWVPFVFLIIEQLRERFDLKLALVLAIILHFAFGPSHMQMLFYLYFALGIYFAFFLIRSLIVKESVKKLIVAGLVLTAATGFAFAMNADQYLSTLEYNPYSIRGANSIQQSQAPSVAGNEKHSNGGLDYDYATNWSFSPGEMMTFVIPSAFGFGSVTYDGVLTAKPTRLNLYFGQQTFTDAPQYMGIVILLLAMAGIILKRKDPFVQYLAILTIVSLFISFGREFSLVYDLMFKYFPIFDKFRIPSMILVLVQIAVPLLAGYGLVALMAERALAPAAAKKWSIAGAAFLALAIVSAAAKEIFLGIYEIVIPKADAAAVLTRMYGNQQGVVDEFYKYIESMVSADITIALSLIAATLTVTYFYKQKKISSLLFSFIIIVLVMGDLWRVAKTPMEFHDRRTVDAQFSSAPDYVKFLQRDSSMFRTLEFVGGQPPYDNRLAYWRIQSAYGYQGAKMRAWQDMVDVGGIGNPLVWGLMNVKYILSDRLDSNQVLVPVFKGQERAVLYNRMELPRAFFVKRYETASGIEILKKIAGASFDPTDVMYLMDDPKIAVEPARAGASAKYLKFGVNDLDIQANATGNNLMFVSEVYYPKGWKAFIDGVETPIYRANYLFRAVVVPRGVHTVTMRFEPREFTLGKNISFGVNLLILGVLGFLFGKKYIKK